MLKVAATINEIFSKKLSYDLTLGRMLMGATGVNEKIERAANGSDFHNITGIQLIVQIEATLRLNDPSKIFVPS